MYDKKTEIDVIFKLSLCLISIFYKKQMETSQKEFAQIVKENKDTIYTVCYMFSNDTEDVNDIFQEVLINLWKGIGSFL